MLNRFSIHNHSQDRFLHLSILLVYRLKNIDYQGQKLRYFAHYCLFQIVTPIFQLLPLQEKIQMIPTTSAVLAFSKFQYPSSSTAPKLLQAWIITNWYQIFQAREIILYVQIKSNY
ncbi:unnamed protein product [Paramecium octaurelia]|uniref:Uncharacterized protein n=1 Tax=Paramecium octaurelia TaxID=43137 RepID=A0A8S1VIH9_PAROT|nr:unnamed protein product [Paramecium octaurelia]